MRKVFLMGLLATAMLNVPITKAANIKDGKVAICHRTAAANNAYVQVVVDRDAWQLDQTGKCPVILQKNGKEDLNNHCMHRHAPLITAGGVQRPDFELKPGYENCQQQYVAELAAPVAAPIFTGVMISCISTKKVIVTLTDGSTQELTCPGRPLAQTDAQKADLQHYVLSIYEGDHNYIEAPINTQSVNILSLNANPYEASVRYFKLSNPDFEYIKYAGNARQAIDSNLQARLDIAGAHYSIECPNGGSLSAWSPDDLSFMQRDCPATGIFTQADLFGEYGVSTVLCPASGKLKISYFDSSEVIAPRDYGCVADSEVNLNLVIPLLALSL